MQDILIRYAISIAVRLSITALISFCTHWILLSCFQVVELDFLYPSEGIHRRWDAGYRITSTAATFDQAAFVLSIPRRKPTDETQETLRTSAFPSTHVKVNSKIQCLTIFHFFLFLLGMFIYCLIFCAGEMGKKPVHCFNLLWTDCLLNLLMSW